MTVKRSSHEIVLAIREDLQKLGQKYAANVKVVEVPPGPPVQSPIVAEVYGLDYAGQQKIAQQIQKVFTETDGHCRY